MKTAATLRLPLFYTHGIGSLPRPRVVRDFLARRPEMPSERFQRVLDDRSFENVCREQIQEILARNGSVSYAMSVADRYAEQSRLALASLPDSEFKRALLWVPDFVVAREK